MPTILESSGLLRPLTEDETGLLTTAYEPFMAEGRFPLFDYVERTLYRADLDAADVLRGLPTLGAHGLYGLVRPAGPQYWGAEQPVVLTLAGLVQCPRAEEDVATFLFVLGFLSDKEQRLRLNPYEVPRLEVPSDHIAQHLRADGFDFVELALKKVRTLLAHEPPDAASGVGGTDEQWVVSVSKDLRRYRGIANAVDYLERVAERFAAPAMTVTESRYPSPLQLPEAIDYLDAVWQVHFKRKLFQLPSATAVVELSLPCASEDEFRSRVSALSDLLARMEVAKPRSSSSAVEGSLGRLMRFLKDSSRAASGPRLNDAVSSLKAIIDIRAGTQHADARRREISGYARLGISYPVQGWAAAWETVQARTVEALNAIREELQRESPS